MFKGIIFDFDGTIMDSEITSYLYIQQLLKTKGFDLSKKEYGKIFSGVPLVENMQNLNDNYGFDFTRESYANGFTLFEKKYFEENEISLKPGIVDLLEFLKRNDIKMIIATSSVKARVIKLLTEKGIIDYFDDFICSEDTKKGKPDPEVFLLAMERLSLKKEECLILEDSQLGIEAAVNAQIPVICIPDLKYPDQEHVDLCLSVVDRIDEVISLIK